MVKRYIYFQKQIEQNFDQIWRIYNVINSVTTSAVGNNTCVVRSYNFFWTTLETTDILESI